MCIWNRAKGIQRPVKGSPELHEVRTTGSALHVPFNKKKPRMEQKQEHRASPAKRKPWLRHTSVAGLIRLMLRSRRRVCVLVPARLGVPPLVSCVSPFCIRVHECLVLLCVCDPRPADQEKPGAPVTAGSLDSSLPQLASLLCFIPRSQTPAEGEKSFYLPAAAASHSLLLDLSLSQSTPPSLARLLLSASSLLLPLSLSL